MSSNTRRIRFSWQSSLQGQLTAYSLLFALVPVVIVAIVAFFQARDSLRQQQNFNIQELAAATSADAERLMESRRGDIEVMAQSPILTSPDTTSEQKSAFLRSISDAYGIYSALYMTDALGTVIAATDNTTSDQSYQVWFQNAIQEELYISDVYFLTSVQDFVVTFSAPVKTLTGELIGVVAGHMDAGVLNTMVAAKRLGKTGEIVLVNSEGRIVAAQDKENIFDDVSDMMSLSSTLDGHRGVTEGVDDHGEESLIGYVPLTTTQDWTVIGILHMTEANEPVDTLSISMLLIGSLVSSIIVITIFITTQRIVQPIIELTKAAKEVGEGNWDYQLEPHSYTEVSTLAKTFNRMTGALRTTQETLQLEVNERRQAEEALRQSQTRLAFLLSASPAVIYTTKPTGNFGATYISANVVDQMGYEAAQFIDDSNFWASHIHPEDAPRVFTELGHLFEAGHHTHEYRFRGKDGNYKWMHDDLKLVRDEDGNPQEIVGSWIDITARKQAEEALRLSESRLKEAQRISQVGNWELDLRSNKLIWSDEVFRIFEIDQDKFDATYEAFLDGIHPDDRNAVNDAYTNSLETKQPYEIAHRLQMQDGRIKYINEQCQTFYDEQGQPTRSVGVVHDITAQREAEEALRIKDRAIESSINAIVMGNMQGEVTYVNKAFIDLWGYQSQLEILGKPAMDLWDYQDTASVVMKSTSEWGSWAGEAIAHRHDGTTFHVQVSQHLVEDINGKPQYLMASFIDITERRLAEAALRESEERYRTVIAAMSEGIVLYDREGNLGTLNSRAERLLGLVVDQPVQLSAVLSMLRLIREDGSIYPFSELPPLVTMQTGEAQRNVIIGVHTLSGELIWLSVNTQPLMRDGEDLPYAIVATFADITDVRKAQQEAFNAALEKERNAILSDFIRDALHEFRTPITIIKTSTYIIGKTSDETMRLKRIGIIHMQITAITQLIDDMLLMWKLDHDYEISQAQFDISDLVWQTIEEYHDNSDNALELECQDNAIQFHGDHELIRRAYRNILQNAIDHSPDGRPITTRISVTEQDIVIQVEDKGSGMDTDELKQIFNRFYRADEAHTERGFGLGLPIAKAIIDIYEGAIEVSSMINKGTTVTIRLPRQDI